MEMPFTASVSWEIQVALHYRQYLLPEVTPAVDTTTSVQEMERIVRPAG